MKNTKVKSLLGCIFALVLVAGLLFSMTACKKNNNNGTEPTESAGTTEGTLSGNATENTQNTEPPETTTPAGTESNQDTPPEESTGAVDCEHIPGEWIEKEPAACNAAGTRYTLCTLCGATVQTETIPVIDHIPGDWVVDKPSSCTTEGSRHQPCTLCKQPVQTETIPMTDHVPGTWEGDAATCDAEGSQYQKCTQCDTILMTITLAKMPHNTKVDHGYKATSVSPGLTDGKTCKLCGKTVLQAQQIPVGKTVDFIYTIDRTAVACTITGLGLYTDSVITVPDAVSGYKVTTVGDNAFEGYAGVTEVVLPKSVKSIGERVFSNCTGLQKIVYAGTTVEWNNITKAASWNADVGNFLIQCTDGTIVNG